MLQLEVSGVHLNWDRNNRNGIIVNESYPNGALFTGEEHKPVLSVEYLDFEYTEKGELRQYNYIEVLTVQGALRFSERQPFTPELEAEVLALAEAWQQPLGQEGNPSPEQLEASVKAHRDALLSMSDWTQVPDAPLSEAKRAEWREYRQALRDLTEQQDFPDVVLPEAPTK